MNYIQWHIGDFLGDTMDMCPATVGAYMRLLMAHYKNGERGIPNDDAKLRRIVACDGRVWARIKKDVLDKFEVNGEWLVHKRVLEECAKCNKRNSKPTQLNTGSATLNGNSAPCKPLKNKEVAPTITNNQEPITKDKKNPTGSKNATRLPPRWELPEDWGDWALGQGLGMDEILNEEEKFRDYWIGVGGAKGRKRDWQATWRNWIRRRKEGIQ